MRSLATRLGCFLLLVFFFATLYVLRPTGPNGPIPFESEAWKDGDIWDRKCMADDAVERFLRPGMSIEECRELLGTDAIMPRWLVYEIWGAREEDPCSPVELVCSREAKVYDDVNPSGYARLNGPPWNECGMGASPWSLSHRRIEAARLALRSGGLERWCADETGARLELAESMRDVINYGWPSDLSIEALESSADHEREAWFFELYTTRSSSSLDLYFEDQVLESVRVYENY